MTIKCQPSNVFLMSVADPVVSGGPVTLFNTLYRVVTHSYSEIHGQVGLGLSSVTVNNYQAKMSSFFTVRFYYTTRHCM